MIINFVGDIALFNIDHNKFEISSEIISVLEKADLNIGNFETPITESENKLEVHPVHLKCSEDSLKIVKNFHAFSLANNHIMDYNEEGLTDTLKALEKNGFGYFGAGINQEDAFKPFLYNKNGYRIAILGATRFANAKKNKPGTAKDSMRLLKTKIKELKKDNYFVIIFFHWGYEYVPYPSPRERKIAHKCIDYGADLIIGSHPHIIQGCEKYKNKYIFYSLGNFVFDRSIFEGLSYYENDKRIFESFILNLNINKNYQVNYKIIPFYFNNDKIELYDESNLNIMINEFNNISEIFNAKYIEYLKVFSKFSKEISEQNIKVRKNYTFQKNKKTFIFILKAFSDANLQDLSNRIIGLLLRK
ncbi:MAG: CapA family protein [Candidatus Kapabacteria bacterium]|nr:CapA family protein [Candidatus Kapabacteria bacterium]